jgi:hypothetical protein
VLIGGYNATAREISKISSEIAVLNERRLFMAVRLGIAEAKKPFH